MPFSSSVIWSGTNSVLRLPQKIILSHLDSDSTKLEHVICIRLVLGITKRCDWLYFLPNNQSVSVFHQHMPRVTQLRFFLSALLRQSRIPIRRRFIRRAGPLLSVNLHREVATGGSLFPSLRRRLVVPAQASNSGSSTVKCSSLSKCFSRIL